MAYFCNSIDEFAMANDSTIPTIDVSPLRSGSEAARREVARQIDAACTDIGFTVAQMFLGRLCQLCSRPFLKLGNKNAVVK